MVEHSFTINLVIRGYHVYKDKWDTLIIGEVLYYEREIENYNNPTLGCAVALKSATLEGALLIRDQSILLFFSPIILSSNSFFLSTNMLNILLITNYQFAPKLAI